MRSSLIRLLSLTLVGCVAVMVGCKEPKASQDAKPTKPADSSTPAAPAAAPAATATAAPATPKPDFTLSAVEITKLYADDPNAAEKTYANKVVRVSGTVTELKDSAYEMTLQGDGKHTVIARMGYENYPKAAKGKKVGDQITLQGTVGIYIDDHLEITQAFKVPE